MSGMGPGGFGLPPAGYYVVPAQAPTYLVSTVDAFGQQRWSVGVPVQQPTPRFVAIQPQPQQQQYVKITGTPAQMEELRRAVASGRTIRFVEVPPPAIQPQPLQSVLAQEPSANEQVPVAVETSLCPPSHALGPMQGDRPPAVTQGAAESGEGRTRAGQRSGTVGGGCERSRVTPAHGAADSNGPRFQPE
jgi:hypothetical protein